MAKDSLINEAKSLNANLNKRKHFCNVAFVVFDKIADYEEFYSWFAHTFFTKIWFKLKKIFCSCCKAQVDRKDYKLLNSFIVEKAPEPEDIIWENLYYTDNERFKRRIKTYFYSFLLTIVNLGIILGLNYAQVNKFL